MKFARSTNYSLKTSNLYIIEYNPKFRRHLKVTLVYYFLIIILLFFQ